MKSVLIKDTTRAQREEIVRRALCDGGCDECSGCGNLGGGRVEEMYRPYIEGKKELREIPVGEIVLPDHLKPKTK